MANGEPLSNEGIMEKTIEKKINENWLRRFNSRLFVVWCLCFAAHHAQIWFLPENKLQYSINGELVAYLTLAFIVFNFVLKCVDSAKIEGLAKVIEALKS
jgi:hypothetical protein